MKNSFGASFVLIWYRDSKKCKLQGWRQPISHICQLAQIKKRIFTYEFAMHTCLDRMNPHIRLQIYFLNSLKGNNNSFVRIETLRNKFNDVLSERADATTVIRGYKDIFVVWDKFITFYAITNKLRNSF